MRKLSLIIFLSLTGLILTIIGTTSCLRRNQLQESQESVARNKEATIKGRYYSKMRFSFLHQGMYSEYMEACNYLYHQAEYAKDTAKMIQGLYELVNALRLLDQTAEAALYKGKADSLSRQYGNRVLAQHLAMFAESRYVDSLIQAGELPSMKDKVFGVVFLPHLVDSSVLNEDYLKAYGGTREMEEIGKDRYLTVGFISFMVITLLVVFFYYWKRKILSDKSSVIQNAEIDEAIKQSPVCQRFLKVENGTPILRPTDSDWKELEMFLNNEYDQFCDKLRGITKMTDMKLHVSMLIKIRMDVKMIATMLHTSKQNVSSIRSRLYMDMFGKKGTAAEWDAFIWSL